MTAVQPSIVDAIRPAPGVYAPQEDSRLLCSVLSASDRIESARVLDLCSGSGVVAVQAAVLGARAVTAFDISDRAVECARSNADRIGVDVDVRVGSYVEAVARGPYDVVAFNPPYVPSMSEPTGPGLHRAWDAGTDGRAVLDVLCTGAHRLLASGGVLFLVQSEFGGTQASLDQLRACGLSADVVERSCIPFGPVMTRRADWLESRGLLEPGVRTEELIVIRAERPV